MRNILNRALGTRSEDQQGFTLIELLVVVGIIVALAAVIVPLVIQFSGQGEVGARAAEASVVQTAIDTMMTQNTAAAITERLVAASAVVDGTETLGIAGGDTLADFMRDLPSECEYYWTTAGLITQDVSVGSVCEP